MLECRHCPEKAEYVLVNYYHTIIMEPDEAHTPCIFCEEHAFDQDQGREICSICENFEIRSEVEILTEDGEEKLYGLKRIYPRGETDDENCCSDHP